MYVCVCVYFAKNVQFFHSSVFESNSMGGESTAGGSVIYTRLDVLVLVLVLVERKGSICWLVVAAVAVAFVIAFIVNDFAVIVSAAVGVTMITIVVVVVIVVDVVVAIVAIIVVFVVVAIIVADAVDVVLVTVMFVGFVAGPMFVAFAASVCVLIAVTGVALSAAVVVVAQLALVVVVIVIVVVVGVGVVVAVNDERL